MTENKNNHPSPPTSERDQEFAHYEAQLRPEDPELARLRRIEVCAKQVVDENDRGTPDGLAVALEALGMLVR